MTTQETSSKQPQENQKQNQQQLNQQDSTKTNDESEGKGSRLDYLNSLLGESGDLDSKKNFDDEDSEDDNDEKTGKDEETEVKLESFDDIAKQLKVDKSKLYDIKLRLKDDAGEVTIGQLKDAFQEGRELDIERIDWGNEKVKQEQELAEARKEIEVLASLLPKDKLNKETMESARKVVKAQMDRQRNDLLKRVPEWQDEEVRKTDIENINEHLKGYGLSFAQISDSRIAHYIRNNYLREQRIEKALAKVRPAKKNTATPSRNSDGQNRKSAGRKVSPRARNIARNFLNQMDD
jgi:hypothetical protein